MTVGMAALIVPSLVLWVTNFYSYNNPFSVRLGLVVAHRGPIARWTSWRDTADAVFLIRRVSGRIMICVNVR